MKPSETARFLDTENSIFLTIIKNHFDEESKKIEALFNLISSCPDPLSSDTIVALPDQKIYIQDQNELIINPSYGINHPNYDQCIQLATDNPKRIFFLLGVAKDILDQKETRSAYLQQNNAILESLLDEIQKILLKNQYQKMSSQKTLMFNMNDFPDFNYQDLKTEIYEQEIVFYLESLLSHIKEWQSKKEAVFEMKEKEFLDAVDLSQFIPLASSTQSFKQYKLKILSELPLQKKMHEKMKNLMAAFEATKDWIDQLLASNKNKQSLNKNAQKFSLFVESLQTLNLHSAHKQELTDFLMFIQTPELKLQKGDEKLADSINRGAQIVNTVLKTNKEAFVETIGTLQAESCLIESTFLKTESLKKIGNQLEQMIHGYNQNIEKLDLKSILKILNV